MNAPTLDDLTEDRPIEDTWGEVFGCATVYDWRRNGFTVQRCLIANDPLGAYAAEWIGAHGHGDHVGKQFPVVVDNGLPVFEHHADGLGWFDGTPYTSHPALLALCCDGGLGYELKLLLGAPAAVHLNLTGWVSTERDWHQDTYLNPPEVGDRYAGVWFALDTIDPRSGPFECVPGSHHWPALVREKFAPYLDLTDPDWPRKSETILSPLFEDELWRRAAGLPLPYSRDTHVKSGVPDAVEAMKFAFAPAERGDVLIWHPRLWHRGTRAQMHGMIRPALIAHYSCQRPDMPPMVQHDNGGWYFPL